MKFPTTYTLKQISEILGVSYVGADNFPVTGMNEIHVVENGDIVFVDHPKYYDKALNCAATTVLINKKVECPEGKSLLISEDPFSDFNKLSQFFKPFERSVETISKSAVIGENTIIQPNVFIGNNVKIGANCLIHANAALYDGCIIGDNVIIQSGSILGSDAFYFKNRPEGFDKLKSCGNVVIEDNVEIGAGCTIDKGVTGSTIIGMGTKLDNQVQVGHDTVIGKKCLIAAQCGIAGCVVIEDEVTLWGQVGVTSAIKIGKGAVVLAQTGISKSIAGGKTYFGSPVEEARKKLKQMADVKKIPSILEKLKQQ
ncbi:UDP-3-O-(3-hydroxymyristoyl)glucosamine N-acyltransferase [Aurantibacter sp.]|uniref:UDP-3-O-(3-hydroxymyristoyl)glucosamine N-acyltransferase n=1 Tax=Aurantibacter sp. TaxID=2807103 RepID=UPI00326340D3